MWVTELDPERHRRGRRGRSSRLRSAEAQLTDYRRALHERLDESTTELIARYRENPASALVAFTTPHTGSAGAGAGMSPSEDLEQIWREFRATGDAGLRNRLVLQYAPLVKYVAGRLRTRMPETVEQDDLVSDGVLGLMDAIERFEPARGLSFQTFAVPRIRGAIIDGMRTMDFVPRSVRDKLRVVQRGQVTLEERLGRVPEDAEVAREVGIPVQQLRDLSRQANSNHANLDDFDLADELSSAADHRVEQGDVNASLMRVVDQLAERDQVIIALYYFEGLTLAEIGQVLGVTESRVSQVHRRATTTLRQKLLELDSA